MRYPLASFPIVSTRDTDEAQSILSRELVGVRFKRVRDRRAFRLEMNGVHLGRTMAGYNQYASDILVDAGEVDDIVALAIGTGPPSVFYLDGKPLVCTAKGAVIAPSRRVVIDRPAGSGIYMIRAKSNAIQERLREVLGRLPQKPIGFHRGVDLAHGVGAHARRLLDVLVETVQRDSAFLDHPLLRAGFDDLLLNALLALPNTYSDELMGGRRLPGAPRVVRRAEAFMEAHATEPITVSDLVTLCGCSRRALFGAFRKYRGYTPMQFLADCRLKSARETLQSLSPRDTVSSIAYACGFAHPGRFANAYRRRFGESPSETLRKAGGSPPP